MVKRYNIKAGVLFSIAISMLSSFPRLIRLDFTLFNVFLSSFVYMFSCTFACWIIHHYFLLTESLHTFLKNHIARAIASISLAVLFIVIITYSFNVVNVMPVAGIPHGEMSVYQVLAIRLFRAIIISAFTYFVVYYFRMMMTLQHSRLENEYLKQENLKAQLASLREQISPHFLFNSLNTLSTLSQDSEVKEYILRMSEVYRYVLHYQQQHETSVRDELAFIQSYTYIMKARFEEGLKINISIASDKMEKKILPLALQLLVENAVKHNAISYQKPLAIDIYDKSDYIVVENDFRPKTVIEKKTGTGLNNLADRYRLTAGKEITITQSDARFKVEIPFLI